MVFATGGLMVLPSLFQHFFFFLLVSSIQHGCVRNHIGNYCRHSVPLQFNILMMLQKWSLCKRLLRASPANKSRSLVLSCDVTWAMLCHKTAVTVARQCSNVSWMPFPLSNFPDLLINSKIWQMVISVPQFLWGSAQPSAIRWMLF